MEMLNGLVYPGKSSPAAYRGHARALPTARLLCLVSIVLAVMAVSPALAGTKYMAGSPTLSAHITGTNEFSPGDDVNLVVAVDNTGLNTYKIVQSGLVDRADQSNTAKQLTAALSAGNAPIVVKADPQVLGDLAASNTASGTYHIKVSQDAASGTYQLPLVLNYTYMYQVEQEGTEVLQYQYKSVNQTVTLPIRVKPVVQIAVTNVSAQDLNAANEGYVTFTVKNTGFENGTNAAVRIAQNDASPITPSEGSVYVGDFPAGATADCRFRVAVSSNAQAKTYPLDVYVNYKNSEGDMVNSKTETIGVPVGGKVAYNATSVKTTVPAGAKSVIVVQYQNTGGATAYNAQARISAVDPFTSNDDTAFLGTMAPGDVKQASFEVSVDASATAKSYGLDSEVIYRDALNNQVTTDPMKVTVTVTPAKSLVDVLGMPGIAAIVIVILAALGYFVYTRRFKPR
jgi:hypothetical protein